MSNAISIRSYSTKPIHHSHDYYQLVLPLSGGISIQVGDFNGKVAVGECVVVRKHETHIFYANPEARFVVADMSDVPDNLSCYTGVVFAVSAPLAHYLSFIEEQLQHPMLSALETSIYNTFYLLLSEQELLPKVDARLANTIRYIHERISTPLTIDALAGVACLSPTQLKLLFKKQIGLTVMSYVTKVRMEKAHALLRNTDYPAQWIGERVGFPQLSAFSRKFSQYFGVSPMKVRR